VRLHGDAVDNARDAVRDDDAARWHRQHIATQIAAIRDPQPVDNRR
jgi:hypothetical protein